MVSDKRCQEVLEYALGKGDAEACRVFSISPITLDRYRRTLGSSAPVSKVVRELQEKYSDGELRSILRGHGIGEHHRPVVQSVNFGGESVKFWFATDFHIGSEVYQAAFLDSLLKEAEDFGAKFGVIAGDLTEGLSTRPGHIYELTHIGYAAQLRYAVEQLSKWKGKLYCISGNHDLWFKKSNGADIVNAICEKLPDADYRGEGEGDIDINGVKVKVWHGEDTSSYATSYRIQKIVESFTGGEKPNVLLCGHTHKQAFFFERHIHCVSGGALSTQSKWMRMKRLANHAGFWMIEMTIRDGSVAKFTPTWYPFYL